jgi:hypothetical protein
VGEVAGQHGLDQELLETGVGRIGPDATDAFDEPRGNAGVAGVDVA